MTKLTFKKLQILAGNQGLDAYKDNTGGNDGNEACVRFTNCTDEQAQGFVNELIKKGYEISGNNYFGYNI